MRVLVVEDHPVNQRVVAGQLAQLGIHADLAEDGPAAVTMAAKAAYDLILMDLQLPGFDGLEAARRIRAAEPAGHRARILAVTAGAQAGEAVHCRAAGLDGLLAKPLLLGDLEAALRGMPPTIPMPVSGHLPRVDSAVWHELAAQSATTDPTLIDDLGGDFLKRAPRFVADIQAALAAGREDEARRLLHRFAGVAGVLGLARLLQVTRQAERDTALWPAVRDEVPATMAVLAEVLAAR
jgi:CheY-like chemotaxis protein